MSSSREDDDLDGIREELDDVKNARREFGKIFKEDDSGISVDEVAEVVEEIFSDTDDTHHLAMELRKSVSSLRRRVDSLEKRVDQIEGESSISPAGMGFDEALAEYDHYMEKGRRLAKDMLEQRKSDQTTYLELSTVVRETEDKNIAYGVKGKIDTMTKTGVFVELKQIFGVFEKSFEDTEVLEVPNRIKKAIRERGS